MDDFRRLEMTDLVDMLSQHTAKYSQILQEGGTDDEYVKCKLMITKIQVEIESRRISPHQSREFIE